MFLLSDFAVFTKKNRLPNYKALIFSKNENRVFLGRLLADACRAILTA